MRSLPVLLLCSGLALSAVEGVEASGFSELRFLTGSGDLSVFSMDSAVATASGTVYGAGAATVSDSRFSRQVTLLRGNVSRGFGDSTLGARGVLFPTTGGSRAEGGGVFFQTRSEDAGDGYDGSWGLAGTFIQHSVRNQPTAPPKRDKRFGEYVLEFNTKQSYFDSFNFLLTMAYFAYDRDLGRVGQFKTTFLQSEAATLGTFAAVTDPPQWTAGLQYARVFEPESDGTLVFGYSRVGLKTGGRHLNSYLAGIQTRLAESLGARIGYNRVNGKGFSSTDYYAFTLSYYWR